LRPRRSKIRARRVGATTIGQPAGQIELPGTVVPVAGVDRVVTTRLALFHRVRLRAVGPRRHVTTGVVRTTSNRSAV